MVCIRRDLVAIQNKCQRIAYSGTKKLEQIKRKICAIWKNFAEKVSHSVQTARRILPGSLNRITTGDKYSAHFRMPASEEGGNPLIPLMEKFSQYDLTSERYYNSSPLSDQQKEKLAEMATRNDEDAVRAERLLEKCKDAKFTHKKFKGDDHIAFDRANFELLRDLMPEMVQFLNSGHFDAMQTDIREKFGFNYYQAVVAEMLARTIAYNSNLDGEKITLPVQLENGVYAEAEFSIKLYCLGDELPAYFLECKDEDGNDLHAPWFVVRGTETNNSKSEGKKIRRAGYESVLADFIHPGGVGDGVVDKSICCTKQVYDAKQEAMVDQPTLQELFANGRQVLLTGHSLGGAIVNQITARMYNNIKQAYAFSAPGVSDATKQFWDLSSPDDSKLINLQVQGDAVPAAGKNLIGTHVALTHLIKPAKASPVHKHVLMCLTKPFTLQYIDKEAEEEQVGRVVAEFARRTFGKGLRFVSKKLDWSLPDWYQNRHVFHMHLRNVVFAHAE